MGFLIRMVVTAASLWVATLIVPGVTIQPQGMDYLVALALSALILGLLNAVVRPILLVLSLPITCLTLGLFIVILNGLMLVLLSLFGFTGFHVDNFLSAILAGVVISITSFLLNRFVPG